MSRRAAGAGPGAAGLTVLDQVVASGSSFAALALVARAVEPSGYAVFTGALAVWFLLLVVTRALVVEPAVLRAPTDPGATADGWARALVAAGASCAALLAAAAVLAVLPAPPALAPAAAALGLALPGLLLQDTTRWLCLARRDVAGALRSDATYAATELALLGALLATGRLGVVTGLVAVGAGALLAAVLDARRAGLALRARPRRAADGGRLGGWLLLDGLATWLNGQATVLLVALVVTAGDAGLLRAANDLFGPLRVLQLCVRAVLLPAAAAAVAGAGLAALRRDLLRAGAVASALSLAYGAAAVAVGAGVLAAAYGPAYRVDRPLLAALAAAGVLATVQMVLIAGLKAAGEARRLALSRLWTTPLGVLLLLGLGAAHGTTGAAVGLALGAALRLVVLAALLRRPAAVPEGTGAVTGAGTPA